MYPSLFLGSEDSGLRLQGFLVGVGDLELLGVGFFRAVGFRLGSRWLGCLKFYFNSTPSMMCRHRMSMCSILRMDLCAQVRSHVRTLQTQAGVCVHIPNSRVYEYGNL